MIFVTGATGNVGSEVARELVKQKLDFRIGVRGNMLEPIETKSSTVQFDFLDPTTFAQAVKGCTAVFLLRPPAISNTKRTLNVFVDVARQSGVKQIVFVSVAGAEHNPLLPHYAVEQHLIIGPADWTILRPGFFVQNLGGPYREDICQDNRIYLPAGQARVAFIDARDIAAVAASALSMPDEHCTKSYTLTGPRALSFTDLAAILSRAIGRHIAYQPASLLGYISHLRGRGMPVMQIAVQTILHVGLRFGQAQSVDLTLGHLLNRKPYSVEDYVRDHHSLWSQSQY